ncbi:PP0621 family protein [Thiolapillus sp.]
MKIIFLLIAVLLVWWILKTLRGNRKADARPTVQNMRACEYCGLHVPEEEAIQNQGRFYCCKEHAQGKPD